MKHLILCVAFIASVVAGNSKAMELKLDSDLSRVSFATIKLQYIVEPASISGLTGQLDASGKVDVNIPLGNIQTGIDIRNQRLNDLFFNSKLYPSVSVSVQLPKTLLSDGQVVKQMDLGARVRLFGTEKTLTFKVNVVKTGDIIAVSTVQPTIVSGSTFGIPSANLAALAKTVGGIGISDTVPVTFSLVFTE